MSVLCIDLNGGNWCLFFVYICMAGSSVCSLYRSKGKAVSVNYIYPEESCFCSLYMSVWRKRFHVLCTCLYRGKRCHVLCVFLYGGEAVSVLCVFLYGGGGFCSLCISVWRWRFLFSVYFCMEVAVSVLCVFLYGGGGFCSLCISVWRWRFLFSVYFCMEVAVSVLCIFLYGGGGFCSLCISVWRWRFLFSVYFCMEVAVSVLCVFLYGGGDFCSLCISVWRWRFLFSVYFCMEVAVSVLCVFLYGGGGFCSLCISVWRWRFLFSVYFCIEGSGVCSLSISVWRGAISLLCVYGLLGLVVKAFASRSGTILASSAGNFPGRYPAMSLAISCQCLEWLARCQYTVTWRDRKFDLQLLSQCGSTYTCLSRPVPEIHLHVAWTLSNQSTNKKHLCVFPFGNFVCRLFWLLSVPASC